MQIVNTTDGTLKAEKNEHAPPKEGRLHDKSFENFDKYLNGKVALDTLHYSIWAFVGFRTPRYLEIVLNLVVAWNHPGRY